MSDKIFRNILISIIATYIVVFAVIPNLLVILYSIMEKGTSEFVVFKFSTDAYRDLLSMDSIPMVKRSFFIAISTTLLTFLLAYPFAYSLHLAKSNTKLILMILIIIPFLTNSLIRSYAIMNIIRGSGPISSILQHFHIIDKPLNILYTTPAILIGMVYTLFPFMVLPLYLAFEKLDKDIINAAKDLGANNFDLLMKILLPLTKNGIFAGIALVFLPSLTMFFIPDLLGGSKTVILGNFIRDSFLKYRDWPLGAATSISLLVILYIFKSIGNKFGSSELKGGEKVGLI